jgi:hypothetical protein
VPSSNPHPQPRKLQRLRHAFCNGLFEVCSSPRSRRWQLRLARSLNNTISCEDSACFAARDDGFEGDRVAPWNAVNLLHTAGHLSVGGLNNDVYASAGDPVFFLHHGMVDRLWTVWQAQRVGREGEVGGGVGDFDGECIAFGRGLGERGVPANVFADPVTPTVQAYAVLEFPGIGADVRLEDALDTLGGEYCYYYE